MKTVPVRSLCTMVSEKKRRKARQFLLGLSTDELQYLAEFLGSCILESEHPYQWTRDQLNQGIQRFDRGQTLQSLSRKSRKCWTTAPACRPPA